MNIKKKDLAYAAGLFDGEGSIGIYNQRNRPRSFRLQCNLSLNNEFLPRWFQMHFGGHVWIKHHCNSKWQNTYCWQIDCKGALPFLKVISPYLIIKRPQAEIAIKFQESRTNRPGLPISDGELAIHEAQAVLMKKLKKETYQ